MFAVRSKFTASGLNKVNYRTYLQSECVSTAFLIHLIEKVNNSPPYLKPQASEISAPFYFQRHFVQPLRTSTQYTVELPTVQENLFCISEIKNIDCTILEHSVHNRNITLICLLRIVEINRVVFSAALSIDKRKEKNVVKTLFEIQETQNRISPLKF